MFKKILIANRGEIALRLVRAVRDLGVASLAVYADDDADSPHVRYADEAVALNAAGPAAYLDMAGLIAVATKHGCDALHPGYGFLSERADFARACADAGIVFIGPSVEHLSLFGDKARARALAQQCAVPLMPGSQCAVTLAEAQAFFAAQENGAGMMVKAIGGGGGRGMRAVLDADSLPEAYARCVSEARAAFGVEGVYVERLMVRARHIEIQILGDGQHSMSLGDRDCSLQRRFQKLVEIAPSPSLPEWLRVQLTNAALKMARAVGFRSLGTFEFLVDETSTALPFVFIEANPRLQVEHTVTEAVTGLDLVQLQISVAAGQTLAALGLDPENPPRPRGFAVQWRINAETLDAQGNVRPSSGTLKRFDLPSGPGIRVDTHGFNGAAPSPRYDTLLAKLIVHSGTTTFADAVRRSRRALEECRIDGVATNLLLLRALAVRPEFADQRIDTRFAETHLEELLATAAAIGASSATEPTAPNTDAIGPSSRSFVQDLADDRFVAMRAPMPARLVQLAVTVGQRVPLNAQIAVLEAMKMEHVLYAPGAGRVAEIRVAVGEHLREGQILVLLEPTEDTLALLHDAERPTPGSMRADLQRVLDRHARTLDAGRPGAVAKRRALGQRTARENIADLCDEDSFIEYGALAVAAQRSRRSEEDLINNTPADGMVTGIGSVNSALFRPQAARDVWAGNPRVVVMSYDATVLAGTQGLRNHQKTDRMLDLALQQKLPVVLFSEGGGGRPGDTDMPIVAGLHVGTFASYARLNGLVPVLGIVTGRCFAGNAALLGCSDVIIATQQSNIGMGGPAMIEGGGLGVFKPEQIGPASVQHKNGVIDLLVDDEAQAVAAAKHYLSFFQTREHPLKDFTAPTAAALRDVVPENRLRVYDTRAAMNGMVDRDSLLHLRTGFGAGIHTALARIEGRPVGLIANNPLHLGGAIDADAADKAARFMQLCNAHGLPLVSLVDTPGFMVGPDVEATAQVRHVSRLFIAAAHLRVPFFSVILRKGYGLGAMAMTAGGFHSPLFTVAWPTGEFGAMGLEGAVKLGYRKELAAASEGAQREALYQQLVAKQYSNGSAINMATTLEIDAVIDPAQTRNWLVRGLQSAQQFAPAAANTSRFIDTW
ncbi:MAG: carbamoyl-phosphate synthase large subunit [Polaromonas sp.]|uniref:carboxyl transferase domain-containing protein n=1 Tax=Polaromonas sp. TaxID=1869339 RepID=UPI00185A2C1D|nr:carboxyl transferase domain-containing protein [Polaromonas sp.]NMM09586.1 carbamoyl-phosphate synthase large subunit [Polaromonas sp.]